MNQANKYVLCVSIVLNGILLMFLAGVVPFLLYLSIVINLVFFWYIAKCIKNLNDIEEDLNNITNKTDEFMAHLERIHGLEIFYGDENLQSMIKHSKQLINDYIELQEKYFDVEVLEEKDAEYDNPPTPAQEAAQE